MLLLEYELYLLRVHKAIIHISPTKRKVGTVGGVSVVNKVNVRLGVCKLNMSLWIFL